MIDPSFTLERVAGRRLWIRIEGTLGRPEFDRLRAECDAALRELPDDGEILFDLRGATRCEVDMCRALARIQRKIAEFSLRTAYLTERPRIRGAAWWIVYASEDPLAMPVVDMSLADRWLAADVRRRDLLQERSARALKRALRKHEREAGGA